MKIYSTQISFNGDEYTPVGLYRQLRNHFRKPCLLESNDYHDRTESRSIIGLDPILELTLISNQFRVKNESSIVIEENHSDPRLAFEKAKTFIEETVFEGDSIVNGFFGRVGFELSHYMERHLPDPTEENALPDLHLFVFRYLIIIDHFTDEGILLKNDLISPVPLDEQEIQALLQSKPVVSLPFECIGEETESLSKNEFLELTNKAIEHCRRGDVFQLVLSNRYRQAYFGDDLEVYRTLRRLNPSPYLFYFDFESYRLMGSSPEAQLKITDGMAEIHPIAGTVPRTGNETEDLERAKRLTRDEKELSEHTMLVDLARNDLSRRAEKVRVETIQELQRFSHVFHLVSKVTAQVNKEDYFQLFCETFPAGTLSGAPKPKALELITRFEKEARSFYGGAVGYFNPGKSLNMAIVIRSICSMDHMLHYQAGAGVVLDSDPENEYREVQHKLRAVRKAIEITHKHFSTRYANYSH